MKKMVVIKDAQQEQSADIARLIMMAMTDDCCLHFCGVGDRHQDQSSDSVSSCQAEQVSSLRSRLLANFHRMMTMLVEDEGSQYSYRNTLVAMEGDRLVGIAVSYDGGRLHELRQAFIQAAKEYLGTDHSGMDDETQAGELYLDSLAVEPDCRRQGIARLLLKATKKKADNMRLPCVGLLVDKGNPTGEALYASVGFRYVNDSSWGGHPMKHLVL